MGSKRRISILVSVIVLTGLLTPGVALAAQPTIERIDVSETFADADLSADCGVPVTTTLDGHLIIRTFEDRTTGVTEVSTINFGFTATSEHGQFRFRDVGADVTRIQPDGTIVISIIGQVPFEFTGITREDGDGNVIFQSGGDRSDKQLAVACARLAL